MQRFFLPMALCALLTGCATRDALRDTQAMTDMDGKPIYPGYTPRVGIAVDIGSWGHRGGVGMGIGTGW